MDDFQTIGICKLWVTFELKMNVELWVTLEFLKAVVMQSHD